MSVKHIYWFAYFSDDEPSVRYRGKYALAHLATHHGITYNLVTPGYSLRNILLFMSVYGSVLIGRKQQSLVVYEKIRTNRFYARALRLLLRLRPHRTLYDIDDAEYLKFPEENIFYFIRNCSVCAVGSNTLGDVARRHSGNVFRLTSPVIDHRQRKQVRNPCFTIGWIGFYNAHRLSLQTLFFPALALLPFPVELVLLGVTSTRHLQEIEDYFREHTNVVLNIPLDIDWKDEQAVYSRLATFDTGIAPLLDTEMNRAKSAYKLKQYMSCGVPVLGSALGENATFLRHGSNGFICSNSTDYATYITQLKEMSDADYETLSANALHTADSFSMQHYCDTLLANV